MQIVTHIEHEQIILKRAAIEIRESTIHRYGVFAVKAIKPGQLIEECPIIIVDKNVDDLKNYLFKWETKEPNKAAIALGYGCVYNHATNPNAEHEYDTDKQMIIFKAERFIAPGEEIFISYGQTWFADRGMKELKTRSKKQEISFFIAKVLVVVATIVMLRMMLK